MDINSFESNDPILAVFSRIHNCFLFIKHSLYQYLLLMAFPRPSGNTGRSTNLFLPQLFKLCYSHGRFCNIGLPRFGRKTFMIYCTRWHFLVVVEMNRVITRGRQNLHQGFNGRPFQSACVLFRTSSFQLLQTWLHARHSTGTMKTRHQSSLHRIAYCMHLTPVCGA